MAPQFVDFNADGHVDIFTATFDGSPHVAYGSPEGFQVPQRIMDANGERVLLTQFWNYDSKEWDDTDRTIESNSDGQLHCISAVAFDWDDDGDFDLLLGDKNRGRLFRQMNEGTNMEPAFTGMNIPVLTGDAQFELDGGMTAPYLVDWDTDGRTDLVCGSFGDSYGDGAGGAVYWYRNIGKIGAPQYAKPVNLIEPSAKDQTTAMRPDSGLYMDVVDYNGDGSLDLVVGGYSHWTPERKPLTDDELKHVADLEVQLAEALKHITELRSKVLLETKDLTKEEESAKLKEVYSTDEYRQQMTEYVKLSQEVAKVKPTNQREAFVWLYLRDPTENPATSR